MAESSVQSGIEYTGSFELTVDGSFRVMVPAAWRMADKDAMLTMIPWPLKSPDHLLVLPPERWQIALQNLKAGFSLTSTQGALVQRVVASSAVRKQLDDTGRLCLGQKLAGLIGVSNRAILAGGLDKFEIWEPTRFAESLQQIQNIADQTLDALTI